MKAYTEIATQADLDALLSRVAEFHDSMVKELHIMSRGWVNPDRSMAVPTRLDARVLIQCQLETLAIELLFIGMSSVELLRPDEFYSATGTVEGIDRPTQKRLISLKFDGHFRIGANRLFFADRSDWWGPEARFGREVPEPDCVSAIALDEHWRQCSACSDAFEAPAHIEYIRCPECGTLAEYEASVPQQAEGVEIE